MLLCKYCSNGVYFAGNNCVCLLVFAERKKKIESKMVERKKEKKKERTKV